MCDISWYLDTKVVSGRLTDLCLKCSAIFLHLVFVLGYGFDNIEFWILQEFHSLNALAYCVVFSKVFRMTSTGRKPKCGRIISRSWSSWNALTERRTYAVVSTSVVPCTYPVSSSQVASLRKSSTSLERRNACSVLPCASMAWKSMVKWNALPQSSFSDE